MNRMYSMAVKTENPEDERLFEELTGCWQDCEELAGVEQVIRESRTAGVTRRTVGFTDREEND
jgi:hypothetical protein